MKRNLQVDKFLLVRILMCLWISNLNLKLTSDSNNFYAKGSSQTDNETNNNVMKKEKIKQRKKFIPKNIKEYEIGEYHDSKLDWVEWADSEWEGIKHGDKLDENEDDDIGQLKITRVIV